MSQNQSQEAIKLKLNELYEDAKTKGTITRDEVANQIMELEIDADQMNKIYETLENLGVTDAAVNAVDKGALDCTIVARVSAAAYRAAKSTDFVWGGKA